MIKLVWDASFKRSYRKRIGRDTRLKKKFWSTLRIFAENPFDSKLKTHKLTGKLSGLWAVSVDYDCRIVFKFYKQTSAVLLSD